MIDDKGQYPNPIACIILIAIVMVLTFLCKKACAGCVKHTVLPQETLSTIAETYLGNPKYWTEIKRNNKLSSKSITAGETLYVYIPETIDFDIACRNIVIQRLEKFSKIPGRSIIANSIIHGIDLASAQISLKFGKTVSPREMLELCYAAVTTAEHESAYRFAVGNAGEVGMFQFRLRTMRGTLKFYTDINMSFYSDEYLVRMLLKPENAAYIFALHFYRLRERCKKSMWCTWRRYNGSGPHARKYAGKTMQRHKKIYNIPPMPRCEAR